MPLSAAKPLSDEAVSAAAASSDRRIWKRRNGSADGTSQLVLRVYDVLYDAGEPLTRDQIVERLVPRLDPYMVGYLEAWYLRHKALARTYVQRGRGGDVSLRTTTRKLTSPDLPVIVHRWMGQVFDQRLQRKGSKTGGSLVRDTAGRYAPGPVAPWTVTLDGKRLPYTPDVRQLLQAEDQLAGRAHLAKLEWSRLMADPAYADLAARAHLVVFLLRHLLTTLPLDERQLRARCAYLLKLTDTPTIKRLIFEAAVKDLLALL